MGVGAAPGHAIAVAVDSKAKLAEFALNPTYSGDSTRLSMILALSPTLRCCQKHVTRDHVISWNIESLKNGRFDIASIRRGRRRCVGSWDSA